MASARATTKVIVVGGGGTMGSSTALHLLRSGYAPANITVLDVYPFPSAQSAGNDLNKIMGIRVSSEAELRLSREAEGMWKNDDLFRPFFHKTGRMDCEVSEKGVAGLRREYETLVKAGLQDSHDWLDTEDQLLEKVPLLSRDNIQGWKAIYSHEGGWLAAAKAINAIGEFCRDQGVNCGFGSAGAFKRPLFSGDDETTCIGVETEDGTKYFADKVVLAAGAWSPTLVDLEDQCCSKTDLANRIAYATLPRKAWVYAHLQLTPQEAAEYRGVPVVYHGDVGFFFEPDERGVVKVCDEFPGFTRYKAHQRPYGYHRDPPSGDDEGDDDDPNGLTISVPRSHAKHPTDTYPDASEASVRRAVATFLPRFAGRDLFNRALCWCTDTADSALLVCEHPRWRNFILATGDSGHTFKLLPNIGKHVVELMEGTLSEEFSRAWRWRPGSGDARKSTRAARAKDLADMPGWNHDGDAKV